MDKTWRSKKLNCLFCALCTIAPVIVLGIMSLLAGKNLFLSVPVWSDELDYWREMYSFSDWGFNFGGSLFAGYEAKIGPFGGHSISPVVVWGLFGRLFQWKWFSIFAFNLGFICLSLLLFCLIVKPSGKEWLLAFAIAFLFPPLNIYLFTSMIEVPLYGGMIIYGALFARYRRTNNKKLLVLLMITGIWCTLVRMTYIVILFPLIMAAGNFKFNKKTIRNLLLYVILFAVAYKVYNLFCAGYPDWVTARISAAEGIKGKLAVVLYNIKDNFFRFFSFRHDGIAQIALRYVYGFVTLFVGIRAFFTKDENKKPSFDFDGEYFSFFAMAGGLIVIMVVLYDIAVWRDYRTFGPVLIFMIIYLCFSKEECHSVSWKRIVAMSAVLCLTICTNPLVLAEDRQIFGNVNGNISLEGFFDEVGPNASVASTLDINWGDIRLMEQIPSQLGFKVYYNDEITIDNVFCADYLLTNRDYLAVHPEIADYYEPLGEVQGYGYLYKVKR